MRARVTLPSSMPGQPVESLPSSAEAATRALFEQELVGVLQLDFEGRLISANRCLATLLGYSHEELRELGLEQLLTPSGRAELWPHFEELRRSGAGRVVEAEYRHKQLSSVWAKTSLAACRDGAGTITSLLGFVVDVTERKRAELNEAFLSELSGRLGALHDGDEIARIALGALSEFLRAPRAFFAEFREAEQRVLVCGQKRGEPAGFSAALSADAPGGIARWQAEAAGSFTLDEDALSLLPLELAGPSARAGAAQQITRVSGCVTLAVIDDARREFQKHELDLLGDLLARVWPLIERSRSTAVLEGKLETTQNLLVEWHRSDAKRRAVDDLLSRITAESERRHRLFETILSGTPDLIYVFDLQRRFIFANAALLEARGRSLREVIGKTCSEVGYPEWQAAMHDSEIDQVKVTKQSIRGEVPFKASNGERIHDYIFVPVIGEDGEVEAIAGTTRDVTVLKQAEHLMAGQAHALELMVRGAPLPEVLEALCDVVDRQATSRLRTSILLMQDDGASLRPAAGRHMPAAWLRAVDPWPVGPDSGGCGTAAYRRQTVICADIMEDPSWVARRELAARHGLRAAWSTPIFSSGGSVLGTLALYYPGIHQPDAIEQRLVEVITRTAGIAIERKRDEEGLRTHSERLRLLWETAAVLLTVEDSETLIRALLARIGPHLGLDVVLSHTASDDESAELRLSFSEGLSEGDVASWTRLPAEHPLLGDVLKTHEPFSLGRLQASTDPAYAPLKAMGLSAYACFPLNADDRLLGTLCIGRRERDEFEVDELEFMRTVSRYMTVAYERLRLVRQLRDADRKKDDFIALLAHELRNPLAPLRNGLHVMRLSPPDSPAVARARAIMERQLSHMVRLIDDLLDVSRISLNKLQLRRARVALSDIVVSAVETARPIIDSAEHQLEVSLPQEPIFLDADLTRLAQVFGNLLTNAAKYTPKRGRITLRAEKQAGEVVVTVEDNGIGLNRESLHSIFDMFSQVDQGFERSTGGLGIGLALVRGLTEMHGGRARAESAGPGHGSRFIVSLPLAQQIEEPKSSSVAPLPTPTDAPRRRILVADDNRDAVESLATMLRMSGSEVHTASDGVEAFDQAERLRPEVVLMDVGMPRLNGREATRRIREQEWGKRMVIIALTGWGQESDRRLSREAGCDEHLVKPVDLGELQRLMRELCSRFESRGAASLSRLRAPEPS
jgi:PAS domain S-box-containing protein